MSNGRIIHVSEMADHPDAIYIGRRNNRRGLPQSPFHNPFPVKTHGRRMAILLYRDYLRSSLVGQSEIMPRLPELRGKPLACWCRHDGEDGPWCHGDVLLEMLDTYTDEQLRPLAS